MDKKNTNNRVSVAQVLADHTGKPVEDFEVPEDIPYPDLAELKSAPAEDFYDSEDLQR